MTLGFKGLNKYYMKTLNGSVGPNTEFCPGVCNAVMYNRFRNRRRS